MNHDYKRTDLLEGTQSLIQEDEAPSQMKYYGKLNDIKTNTEAFLNTNSAREQFICGTCQKQEPCGSNIDVINSSVDDFIKQLTVDLNHPVFDDENWLIDDLRHLSPTLW